MSTTLNPAKRLQGQNHGRDARGRTAYRLRWLAPLQLPAITLALSTGAIFITEPARAIVELILAVGAPVYILSKSYVQPAKLSEQPLWLGAIVGVLACWILGQIALLELHVQPSPAASLAVLACLLAPAPIACYLQWFKTKAQPAPATLRDVADDMRSLWLRALRAARGGPAPAVACGCAVAGAAVLVYANHIASLGGSPATSYIYFWAGMALVVVPLITAAVTSRTRAAQLLSLALFGLAIYLPHFVRAPLSPATGDEYSHLGAARELLQQGHLYPAQPFVPVASYYPGLESFAVAFHDLTGASLWACGSVLIAGLHALAIPGIALLAAAALPSLSRASIYSGLVYAVSPAFIWFDSWYSYESVAVPLAIWAVALTATAFTARDKRGAAWALSLAVVIAWATSLTHHVTSYFLILTMLALGVVHIGRPGRHCARRAVAVPVIASSSALAVFAVAWVLVHNIPISFYLTTPLIGGFRDLVAIVLGQHQAAGVTVTSVMPAERSLFSGSLLPVYERALAFAVPPIALGLCALGFLGAIHNLTRTAFVTALIGGAYFASLPLALTSSASPTAHRSWTLSYIGLAVFAGPGLLKLESLVAFCRRRALVLNGVLQRRALAGAASVIAIVCAVLVGNYGSGVSDYWQFSGPFLVNIDGRSASRSVVDAAKWMERVSPHNARIIATSNEAAVFFGFSTAIDPSTTLSWELFFRPNPVPRRLLEALRVERVQYIVVDYRLAEELPTSLPYFSPYEPILASYPLPMSWLTKFSHEAWLAPAYANGPVQIFRVITRKLPQ